MWSLAAVLAAASLLPCGPALPEGPAPAPAPAKDAPAKDAPAENVADEKAKEAIERFRKDFDTQDIDYKRDAIIRLSKVMHPDVAGVLLDEALKGKDLSLRSAAFTGLGLQKTSTKTVGPRVSRWLLEAAKESKAAKARGNYGVVIDPRTGDTDTTSEEGKAALRGKRERGRMVAEAMKLLDLLGYREKDSVEGLQEFLTDGNDDVVVVTLGMLGKWKEWTVLPEIQELFDIYPEEDSYQTGSVSVDTGAAGSADATAAKRKWMAKFGDPDKRRPRPKVVKAIKKALLDITGEEIKDPAALKEYRKRPDVKRKEKGR
jgi:hypothetical protein